MQRRSGSYKTSQVSTNRREKLAVSEVEFPVEKKSSVLQIDASDQIDPRIIFLLRFNVKTKIIESHTETEMLPDIVLQGDPCIIKNTFETRNFEIENVNTLLEEEFFCEGKISANGDERKRRRDVCFFIANCGGLNTNGNWKNV